MDKKKLMAALLGGYKPKPTGLLGGQQGLYGPMGSGTKYGTRQDGTAKNEGYLGLLNRPDGNISTEISSSTDAIGGQEFPLLVPTLSPDEVTHLLSLPQDENFYRNLDPNIMRKAEEFAKYRVSRGLSPFAARGEQRKK